MRQCLRNIDHCKDEAVWDTLTLRELTGVGICTYHPHPNPLPEGEGACRLRNEMIHLFIIRRSRSARLRSGPGLLAGR